MSYVVNLEVEVGEGAAGAVVSVECPSGTFEVEGRARASRHDTKGHTAGDPAAARALQGVEAQLMEHVHECIDRAPMTPDVGRME